MKLKMIGGVSKSLIRIYMLSTEYIEKTEIKHKISGDIERSRIIMYNEEQSAIILKQLIGKEVTLEQLCSISTEYKYLIEPTDEEIFFNRGILHSYSWADPEIQKQRLIHKGYTTEKVNKLKGQALYIKQNLIY